MFTCVVSNVAGPITSSAKLLVFEKKRPECGVPKITTRHRIAGGRISRPGTHPWIAMFRRKSDKKVLCTGSLIARKWVLTAAICFLDPPMIDPHVKFGKTRVKNEGTEQIRSIKRFYTHPQFSNITLDSDIVLVELDKPVIITDYVIPICLPHDDSDFKLLKPGVEAMIAGWGSEDEIQAQEGETSKRLREVRLSLVDYELCARRMAYPLTANMFCAAEGGKGGACKGDSGGPLTVWNAKTKKHVLMGIVSWGEGCGKEDSFGVYVKVSNFIAWVNSYIL
ncbi:vitamin K-dependent protein C-like isoform X2 [Rhopilema esculentum]|uniref:vitamin K-dependent protein C-like isoform X2 n=1 Tax=Rhopilema esculentum TaxID=499914 RepID=UPI0031D363D6